ncbi:MAG: hypothetical protein K2L89_00675 [Muribaculaceae bacterium]|nr:hypothetical protein [Muribaculaceae bacterium]
MENREKIRQLIDILNTRFGIDVFFQKDYTSEIITAISHIPSVNLSRFNVGIGHGQNRAWEVGNKSPYDDLDTTMSGTRISM